MLLRPFDRQHLAAGADAGAWASWSTTPSSCSRTSSATSRRARSRWRPRFKGSQGGRLHHHLDDAVAGRGVHPGAVHGRRGRPHVQRVRPTSSRFAILISGIVSLTLTPMLCSRLLKPIDHHEKHNFLLRSFEWSFNKVPSGYALGAARTVTLPAIVLAITLGDLRADRRPVPGDPQGLLPAPRTSARSPARPSAPTTPRSTPWSARQSGAGRDHQARSRRRCS